MLVFVVLGALCLAALISGRTWLLPLPFAFAVLLQVNIHLDGVVLEPLPWWGWIAACSIVGTGLVAVGLLLHEPLFARGRSPVAARALARRRTYLLMLLGGLLAAGLTGVWMWGRSSHHIPDENVTHTPYYSPPVSGVPE